MGTRFRFYERFSNARIRNQWEMIPMTVMRLKGQKPNGKLRLEVSHMALLKDEVTIYATTDFHTILVDDIDDSPQSSYPKARVRLMGEESGQRVFALIENLNLEVNGAECNITFSPVPFGPNGKPVLPYKDRTLEAFLQVVRATLLWPNPHICAEELAAEIRPLRIVGHEEFSVETAELYLVELDKLQVTQPEKKGGITTWRKILMAPQAFENIFGVKLT